VSSHKKIDSREVGLIIGLIFGKYFFKLNHLHYGYWLNNMEVDISNVGKAQSDYANLLFSNIPQGVKTILDVGCGVGSNALLLSNKGYKVDCLSPSPLLTQYAKEKVGDKCEFFESTYEELNTDKKYDLILFSESYQYINLEKSLQNSIHLLNDGGHILISDFFRTEAPGKSSLGGGHSLKEFYEVISRSPFVNVTDIDITKETAPNMTLVSDFFTDLGHPVWKLINYWLDTNHPYIAKFLKWKYKKKIEKIEWKYFSNTRNADEFQIHKSYRILLYKRK
jgi:SAM-dependent methyltransferase